MTRYFTNDYRRNTKLSFAQAKIGRVGFGEKDYLEKYGERALSFNGIGKNPLILQLVFPNDLKSLIYFNRRVSKINNSKKPEGLELKAVLQGERVVGIDI